MALSPVSVVRCFCPIRRARALPSRTHFCCSYVVFGKTVPDISLKRSSPILAMPNLQDVAFRPGQAENSFTARSKVDLLGAFAKNSNGKDRGIVYVWDHRLQIQHGSRKILTLDNIRLGFVVMVAKQNTAVAAYETVVPSLPEMVPADELSVPGRPWIYSTLRPRPGWKFLLVRRLRDRRAD